VIRRLPPTMTQDQFLEQVSPLPEHDYMYFVKADMSLGQFAFSRAYINFMEQQDIFMFREKFDNYVFVDSKGVEYPAVVEFAPFQRLPKKRAGKKKDLKCGTIESDSYYISFLENLKNQEIDSSVAQSKTEYSYQPPDSKYFLFCVRTRIRVKNMQIRCMQIRNECINIIMIVFLQTQ
jgi:regulator of nonsense transcripts 3